MSARDFAISVVGTLRHNGHQAYLVGGCVRDLLLGREPSDWDVSTDATPEQVMRIFPETYAVGAQFGVVLVPLPKELRRSRSNPEAALRPALEVVRWQIERRGVFPLWRKDRARRR